MQLQKNWCDKFSDRELVEKSLKNMDCFTCIYERYEKRLIYYILRISSFSFNEAEEVLQESFVKAWQNLNEFDTNLKFSSWIYRIVHNTTITEWKKTQSKGKDQKQEWDENLFQNLPSLIDIQEDFNKNFDKKNIRKVLELMPDKYREVLVLQFLEDKNYQEISDILKKPTGTVATLINRAKKRFRQLALKKQISF